MENINDILNITESNGVTRWTVNTTKSNMIGFKRNEKLSAELANWKIHKKFAEKYGMMFSYPEDYVSIYILISLLKKFRILCHPHEQETNSSIDKLKLDYDNVSWLYKEEIHYDKEYKYNIYSKEFYRTAFQDFTDNRGILKTVWDLAFKKNLKSRIYELSNSYQIHQAVICGGNGDVHKCPNYFGLETDEQKKSIIKILSSEEEPTILEILDNCEFFIADYKGEDLGYARQLNLYTKKIELNHILSSITNKFSNFQTDLVGINTSSKNLEQYAIKLDEFEKRYGC